MRNDETFKVTTPSDYEISMSRTFDAPRDLVYQGITKPELVKQWLTGPPGWTMPVCEMDVRVGGAYRFQWSGPEGKVMAAGGVFREVTPPAGFKASERFDEAWYPGEALVTYTLEEMGSQTLLTLNIRYATVEGRDAALKAPMDKGVSISFSQLEGLLASQAAAA
jgi:uncharacterized protein YndB with AHSA1/START domain